MRSMAGIRGGAMLIGTALTGTITSPTGNPFVVAGEASGNPQPFTVSASGFTQNPLVYVEQCDAIAPTAPLG